MLWLVNKHGITIHGRNSPILWKWKYLFIFSHLLLSNFFLRVGWSKAPSHNCSPLSILHLMWAWKYMIIEISHGEECSWTHYVLLVTVEVCSIVSVHWDMWHKLEKSHATLYFNSLLFSGCSIVQIEMIYKIIAHMAANDRAIIAEGQCGSPQSVEVFLGECNVDELYWVCLVML